jgi:hypothetical protein
MSQLPLLTLHELRMNWSNIEKCRNLLKIGTIVLSSILKYCDKFKKIWSRNFKVRYYLLKFRDILHVFYEKWSNGRIKIDKKHISKRPIFLKFFTHKVSIS